MKTSGMLLFVVKQWNGMDYEDKVKKTVLITTKFHEAITRCKEPATNESTWDYDLDRSVELDPRDAYRIEVYMDGIEGLITIFDWQGDEDSWFRESGYKGSPDWTIPHRINLLRGQGASQAVLLDLNAKAWDNYWNLCKSSST